MTTKASMTTRDHKSGIVGVVLSEDEYAVNPMYDEETGAKNDASDLEMQQLPTDEPADEEDVDSCSDGEPSPITTNEQDLKTVKLGYTIIILLFIVGVSSGIMNGLVIWMVSLLSKAQAKLLMISDVGPFYFMLTTSALAALSAFIIKVGAEPGTTGAGMAEVKALLVSDFHPTEFPKLVSLKIMFLRFFSLIAAAGSGLSIGLAACLTHTTVCFSYALMKFVPDFGELIDNPAMLKQIFAASAAVGFTSVSDTPVGGLLFSIEVTSAYYLISNYWRSFMAATAGAVVYNLVLAARKEEGRFIPIDTVHDPYSKVEFIFYAMLGVICGCAGLFYIRMHQAWFLFVKPYMIKHPVALAAATGAFTAVMIYAIGAYDENGVHVAVTLRDCFDNGKVSEMQLYHNNVAPAGGEIATLIIRVILTVLATTLRISAGIFICMLTVGAQIGRLFGLIIQAAAPSSGSIYVSGYSMVGAVAFASATTHTISAAVILIEMTGEIDMLLPCLVGAVIACGITKSRSLSLYDQGMVNKGLESFELLMQNTSGYHIAGELIDKRTTSVTNFCTVGDLLTLLRSDKQLIFPVVDNAEDQHLIGAIDRHDIFRYLKTRFEEKQLGAYLRAGLPVDTHLDDQMILRQKKLEARRAWISAAANRHSSSNNEESPAAADEHIRKGLFPSPYQLRYLRTDEEGNPTHDTVKHKLHHAYSAFHHKVTSMVSPKPSSSSGTSGGGDSNQTGGDNRFPSIATAGSESNMHQLEIRDLLLLSAVEIAQEPQLPLNLSPFTAHRTTSLEQLYVLFEMVKVSCVFVVTGEKVLEGMISKDNLLQSLRKKVT